jgi:hypothetical protein
MQPITIHIAWQEKDSIHAFQDERRTFRGRILVEYATAGFLLIAAITIILLGGLQDFFFTFILFICLFVAVIFATNQPRGLWQAKRNFKKNSILREPCDLTFDLEGISQKCPKVDMHVDWSAFRYFEEHEHTFILGITKTQKVILPKRCFTAQAQNDFRSLVRQKVAPASS